MGQLLEVLLHLERLEMPKQHMIDELKRYLIIYPDQTLLEQQMSAYYCVTINLASHSTLVWPKRSPFSLQI